MDIFFCGNLCVTDRSHHSDRHSFAHHLESQHIASIGHTILVQNLYGDKLVSLYHVDVSWNPNLHKEIQHKQ